MKKITVTIDADGKSSLDLVGFHGKGCAKVEADFRGDDKTLTTTNKPEYALAEVKAGVTQRQ